MLSLREVALGTCVAQALHMCSVALTAALRQRVSAAAPKWGPFSGPEKGPKAANPNCWGSDFWGLFFVRKMDAKLAPPFDFGVALVFMREGCFFGAACRISSVMFATPSLVSMCPAGWQCVRRAAQCDIPAIRRWLRPAAALSACRASALWGVMPGGRCVL